MSANFLKGTAILTIGLFLSKILGVIYVIPFYAMVGEENTTLYQYAYIPYNLMLAVAISGAPIAFSKFVSRYNSVGDYKTGRKLLKSGLLTMLVTGFLSFLILYFLAEPLARIIIKPDDKIFTVEDVRDVIRWVSFALIVVPFMSLWRGFFQGYHYMMPTAVSQLIEQIVRIAFLLVGAYVVINLLNGSPKVAIQVAVLSAFVGALGGLAILSYFWRKKKPEYNRLLEGSQSSHDVGLKDMYKEIIAYAIPVVFLGVANPLFQFVDLLTFNRAMIDSVNAIKSNTFLGILNFQAHKLVMIPVMLATGFSMALIPLITKYFTTDEHKSLTRTLDQTFQLLLFLTLPAVIGMTVLARELYYVFYEPSKIGSDILAHYLPVAILFSLFPVTAAILQGINQQKWIILNLLIGLLLKLALNIPFIHLWETNGAIAATIVGYTVATGMNIWVMAITLNYHSQLIIRRIGWISLMNVALFAVAWVSRKLILLVWSPDTKLEALLFLFIIAMIGGAVYAYLGLRSGIAQKLFGARLTKYTKKFGWT
ncbi:putative polysaccharide biosynthesis protein [Paenisporosarcina cavernae]|uniref:Polysaccharide biosynthesis protein n=1 Tax=Paenisporosarcina cavernae TaxID=2320858 RepID=A0A385YTQ6_9BACL|nr:polysaccharide biosynthesis protein [Paenisporosarcina cavernae]AYC29891.1 polysaccharide biosynthesis protein [Paenisporosarcina cavernae]